MLIAYTDNYGHTEPPIEATPEELARFNAELDELGLDEWGHWHIWEPSNA